MALLLETTLGDLVIDLDIEGSPELSRNVLKLAKARYYTACLFFSVLPNRFCQTGDPSGDGSGGACIFGLIDDASNESSSTTIEKNPKRFLKSQGRVLSNAECQERGRVVATELNGIPDTIGSQFLITLAEGPDRALDGYRMATESHQDASDSMRPKYFSLGVVTEDESNVLDQIHDAYCDAQGRPYADIRIIRALVLYDPFDDPPGMEKLLQKRGVLFAEDNATVTASPNYERPPEERVEIRISADQIEPEEDELDDKAARERDERIKQKEDKSRAVVLEMLGDLPSAEIKAPENVLFICKLNPVTDDEDLELIFSRFDPNVKVDIIRDADTGASLQYAFAEFSTKDQCVEAYFKMNNALVDDRRIKVDFSQSVAKMWDKYAQRMRGSAATGGRRDTQGRGPERGRGRGRGGSYQSRQQQRPEVPSGGDSRKRWEAPAQAQHPAGYHTRSPSPKRNGGSRYDDARRYSDDRSHRNIERHDSRRRSPERDGRHHRDDHRRRSRSESSTDDRSRDRKRRSHHHSKRRHRHERRHDDERRRHRKHDDEERRDRKHRKHRRRSRSRSPSRS